MENLIANLKSLQKKYNISDKDIEVLEKYLDNIQNTFENLDFKNKRALKDKSVIHSLLKKTSEDLISSEKKYRSFVENINDTIWEIDLNAEFTFLSPQVNNLLGYDVSELLGKPIYTVTDPNQKIFFAELIEKSFKDAKPIGSFEHCDLHKNGSKIYVETNANPVFDDEGKLIGYNGVSRDITQRKLAQEAQDKSEENLKAIVSSLDDVVIEVNQDLIFTGVWTSDESKLFFPIKDPLGKKISEVLEHSDFALLMETIILDVFENGNTKIFEYESILPNDERYFEAKVTLIRKDESGAKTASLLISDITQRKKGEFAIIKAKEEADRANKLKSEFLANMSHEIRTPMNAILGFAELLKDKITEPKYENYLAGIITGGKNLLSIINDILDLSKIESGKIELQYEQLSISSLCDEMNQVFGIKEQEKGVVFKIEKNENIPDFIYLDEIRVRQVLTNLIGNAFKFTSEGSVKLIVDAQNISNQKIDLRFEIKDTGIGIPDDQVNIIFEAFRQREGQNTRKYGGTGLGLTITRRLIQMMNGIIQVKSKLDVGSSFIVTFKDVSFSSIKNQTEQIPEVQKPKSSYKINFENQIILLAEDIETNRMVIRGYLEQTNLKILEAENGEDAVEMTKIYKPDLILMDIQMPIMDGYEASKRIKLEPWLKKIPIVALTASVMQDQVKEFSAYCDGYLKKPVSKNELFSEIKKHLKHDDLSEQIKETVNVEENNETSVTDLSKRTIIQKELLSKLKGDELMKWNNVKNGMMIDEIMDFANELIALGKQNNIEELELYGKDLYESADSFKIEKMTKRLDYYPQLLTVFAT